MSPPVTTTKTIQHFSHQAHPLTELHDPKVYLCDGCKTLGSGMRYQCNRCDFDLHRVCGTPPSRIASSSVHPKHELTLLVTKQNDRFCDACGELVKGLLSYRCNICEFNVHPSCNQLPQTVQHGVHPQHLSTLQPPPPSSSQMQYSLCTICNFFCKNWSYKCQEACGVHLHINCVTRPWSTSILSSSYMHPQHPLSLVLRKPEGSSRQNNRFCDACGEQVNGLFYRCKICDFDVHPICVNLPENIKHWAHPDHLLTLQSSSQLQQLSLCNLCISTLQNLGIQMCTMSYSTPYRQLPQTVQNRGAQ